MNQPAESFCLLVFSASSVVDTLGGCSHEIFISTLSPLQYGHPTPDFFLPDLPIFLLPGPDQLANALSLIMTLYIF